MQAFEATLNRTANLMTAPQGTVWKAMWRQHGKTFMIAGFIKLVHDCVMFLGPFVLEQLLIFLEKGGTVCKQFSSSTCIVITCSGLSLLLKVALTYPLIMFLCMLT